ncbi:hypothetical protein [Thermicanus aegyptius]|uniref:hypothetical protein n=1 Tax=Thermicanus aegyptius TaxID=94009 RepID=UPI0003F5A2DA|nr:hypothetical protein [Thermicanus aegyptius]
MIDIPLLMLIGSFAVGGWLVKILYIPKEEGNVQMDLWFGMGLIGLAGYKLTPLLFTPTLLLRPFDLWILNSGEIGFIVGLFLALLYFLFKHRNNWGTIKEDWIYLILLFSFGYTLYSLLRFEVYEGQYVGLYRGILGLTFLHFMKWNRNLEAWLLPLYAGGLLLIESLSFSRLFWGFSFTQWLIMLLFFFYLIFSYLTERRLRRE